MKKFDRKLCNTYSFGNDDGLYNRKAFYKVKHCIHYLLVSSSFLDVCLLIKYLHDPPTPFVYVGDESPAI